MGVQYILLKLRWFKSEEGTLGCLFFSKREFCFQEDTFLMDYCHAYIDKVHQNMYVHEYVKLHKISEKESILSYCVIKIKPAYGNRRAF